MKRVEFVKRLIDAGCVLHRHGSRHDIFSNPATGMKQPVPRHIEIDDALVKHIEKHLGLKK
jgi:hypothetical protein